VGETRYSEPMTEGLLPPVVILNEPQLAENIGAVARVMANFGLSDLRMVRPRDGWPQERAWPSASGADWPLNNAQVFDTLEAAAGDLHRLFATTARPRETRLPILTAREGAAELTAAAHAGLKIGYLYGGERAGLETADIALCHGIVTIPIDPKFRSLNLAQAVAITAYEWRMGLANLAPETMKGEDEPAPLAEVTGFYEHLEQELEASGFFFPPEKKPSMIRNLRVIFARARLSTQETRTLRGVITALTKGRGRVLARLAAEKAAREG
jgi:tRNA/rRNA methyltransferase